MNNGRYLTYFICKIFAFGSHGSITHPAMYNIILFPSETAISNLYSTNEIRTDKID